LEPVKLSTCKAWNWASLSTYQSDALITLSDESRQHRLQPAFPDARLNVHTARAPSEAIRPGEFIDGVFKMLPPRFYRVELRIVWTRCHIFRNEHENQE